MSDQMREKLTQELNIENHLPIICELYRSGLTLQRARHLLQNARQANILNDYEIAELDKGFRVTIKTRLPDGNHLTTTFLRRKGQ